MLRFMQRANFKVGFHSLGVLKFLRKSKESVRTKTIFPALETFKKHGKFNKKYLNLVQNCEELKVASFSGRHNVWLY